jgi:hypothetical protein
MTPKVGAVAFAWAGQAMVTLANQAIIIDVVRSPAMPITAAQMQSDLKLLNEAVGKVGAVLPTDTSSIL